jgi:hypothetical protein
MDFPTRTLHQRIGPFALRRIPEAAVETALRSRPPTPHHLQTLRDLAGTKIERASWDRQVSLDLSTSRGVQFKLWCGKPAPIAYFSLYFQSGDGWYHGSFFPEVTNGWNVISLDKSAMSTEGKPAGWGSIRTIRLSAWRAQDRDTEFHLTDLRETGVLGADATVAVLRAESVAQNSPAEARSIDQFTEGMAQALEALELGCAVVSDLDVTAERLRHAKVVVLPHNPSLPDRAAEASRDAGLKAAAAGRYAEALDALSAAAQQIERAFCLAQRPLVGEFRAFWCHSAFGVEGLTWDEAIRRLAENGSMVEVARRYDVDGLHFDYIRYPDGEHCFCAGCRERFQRVAQTTLVNWPSAVRAGGP